MGVNIPGAADAVVRSGALTTFPPVSFLYLQLHAAAGDDSAFADNDDVNAAAGYYQRPHTSLSGGGLDRSVSEGSRHSRQRPLSTCRDVDEVAPGGTFQRSVSESVGIGQDTRLKGGTNR